MKYPDLGFDAKALSKGAISAIRAGKKEKAQALFQKLKSKFSETSEYQDAAKEMNE